MQAVGQDYDVAIIGAGPAGTVAAALLQAKGYSVRIFERQYFPRFSIGESLLPQCMEFLAEADLLDAVLASADEHHFQFKNGASFVRGEECSDFDFRDKYTEGWGTTFQVQRAHFDTVLADQVEQRGVRISWGHEIVAVTVQDGGVNVEARDSNGSLSSTSASFVLDASGFGRVLPRLFSLNIPSNFPSRASLFSHVQDNISAAEFDRNKIRIAVHHKYQDVWFWLIPFSNGRSSLGVVAQEDFLSQFSGNEEDRLRAIIDDEPTFSSLLAHASFDTPVRQITGYASNVSTLHGEGFALLGNAGEFLDPVFSSGVTIAMKSASLAAVALDRQLKGEDVDWETDYAQPLRAGVDTFRAFVEAWYDGRFQDIIFSRDQSPEVKQMISAILAGYAWDLSNPYVKESERRINTLAELCRS